jgi:mycothiol system anti-sigma-R factor
MIDCDALLQQLWDYLDDELPSARRDEIEEHLQGCSECFNAARFDSAFLKQLRGLRGSETVPDELRQRLAAMIKRNWPPPV